MAADCTPPPLLQVAADSPEASKPLHGPNQWPEESLLPGLRSVYGQYSEELRLLGMRCEGGGQGDGQGRGHVALVRLCHLPASTPLSTTLYLSGCCGCWPSRWTCPHRTSTRTLSSRCSCSDLCITRGASVRLRMASSVQVSLGCLEGAEQSREGRKDREVLTAEDRRRRGDSASSHRRSGCLAPANDYGNTNSRMSGSAKTPVLTPPPVRCAHRLRHVDPPGQR